MLDFSNTVSFQNRGLGNAKENVFSPYLKPGTPARIRQEVYFSEKLAINLRDYKSWYKNTMSSY